MSRLVSESRQNVAGGLRLTWALWPLSALATIFLLYFSRPVLVPLLLALLLTQLLTPLVRRLERTLPSAVSVFAAMSLVGALVASVFAMLSNQMALLQGSMPQLKARIGELMQLVSSQLARYGLPQKDRINIVNKGLENSLEASGEVAVSALSTTFSTLFEAALVLILTFLMLIYRRHFHLQLHRLAARQHWTIFSRVVEHVAAVGQRYVAGLGFVVALVGVLDTVGFMLLDAPFPLLFGLCGALAVMIPYVGIVVVAPICAALTWISTGSASAVGGVLAVFTVVHFVEGNLISPYFVGSRVNLNPLATIMAVLIGGKLWGSAGMFLFIPLIGILKLVLDAVPAAEPLSKILGSVDPDSIQPRVKRRMRIPELLSRRYKLSH